jgi:hypothetical protein
MPDRRRAVLDLLPRGGEGCEIGVFEGDFSAALLGHLRPQRLHLVDPWRSSHNPEQASALYAAGSGHDMEAVHASVQRRFAAEIADGTVRPIRGSVVEADALLPDASLDFAYIDGDHREAAVLADLEFALRKLRPGGIVALDDYHLGGWWGDGVHRGAHRALGRHPEALEIVAAPGDQLVLRRR